MSLAASLAAIVTLVAWILEMVLFGVVKGDYKDSGSTAQYGNANWIVLGALAALWVGACVAGCGVFGSYRRSRAAY